MSDRDRPYRSREEERTWRTERDPIERMTNLLKEDGYATQAELDSVYAQVQQKIAAAIEFAKNGQDPDPSEVRMHVYAD